MSMSVERCIHGSRNWEDINRSDVREFRLPRTFGNQCMDVHERGVFRVFYVGAIDEILKKKKVSRTTLDDCEKPVP